MSITQQFVILDFLFIGQDGSMGYVANQIYTLKIALGTLIVIQCDENPRGHCPYSNMESFLKNWLVTEKNFAQDEHKIFS